jgi:hypothetical protein
MQIDRKYRIDTDSADEPKRQELTRTAGLEIMRETLDRQSGNMDLLSQVMLGRTEEERRKVARGICLELEKNDPASLAERAEALLNGRISPEQLHERFDKFEVDASPEPAKMAPSLSRLTKVAGLVLGSVAGDYNSGKGVSVAGVLATIGQILTELLAVLLPGTWREILTRRLFQLLMVFGILCLIF